MRRALPVLTSAGVPATVFVSTDHVARQRGFWWDEVRRLLRRGADRPLRLTVDGDTRAWARAGAAERHLVAWLQPKAPEAIEGGLAELRAWAGAEPAVPADERPLTRRGAARPVGVVAHRRRRAHPHARQPALRGLRAAHGRAVGQPRGPRELAGQRVPPHGLAYPFGIPGADVDADTRVAARSAGFRYAVLNSPGTVTADTDRYGLPRLPVENTGADAFASLISRATGRS